MMDPKIIWSKFILAQEKILESKSLPISVDPETISIKNNRITINADADAYKKILKYDLQRLFQLSNVDFTKNHILQELTITENISSQALLSFKQNAANCYINFSENPVIEGEISLNNSAYNEIVSLVGSRAKTEEFKKSGILFLTLNERDLLGNIADLKFNASGRARIAARPRLKTVIQKIYPNTSLTENKDEIKISGQFHPPVFRLLHGHFGLSVAGYELRFTATDQTDLHRKLENLKAKGITLPEPVQGTFAFCLNEKDIQNSGLNITDEYDRISGVFARYFPENNFTFEYFTRYRAKRSVFWDQEAIDFIDEGDFYENLRIDLGENGYSVSPQNNAVFFEFEDMFQLNDKVKLLARLEYLDFDGFDDEHLFRFSVRCDDEMAAIEKLLKIRMPDLTIKLDAGENKLIFRKFYRPGDKIFVTDQLRDRFNEIPELIHCNIHIQDSFMEKYLFEEYKELRVEEEQERLQKLKGEDFYFNDKTEGRYLGKLARVSYPRLEFIIEDNDMVADVVMKIESEEVYAVLPDLKGETDKILRLTDTIRKLGSDVKLPNNNAKQFLFDASSAAKIPNIEELLKDSSSEWIEFENGVFSNHLNISQKQAVFKSLYSTELALIQGPPGTGKSTAIAEIIWQHVRKNQREKILLTSETNLAVDNAIDRLKNDTHNIVKPIRFGNSEKLESEGRFYALDIIEQWVTSGEEPANAVSHWIGNIAARIQTSGANGLGKALGKWKMSLNQPDESVRRVFAESYITAANLIGATGSSIGKLNSEGKFTGFFKSYLSIFHRKDYVYERNKKKCDGASIWFDTVVMDEASKATPPELALPVLFAKKAIIVGDHRQLPPMVDGEEIKDVLVELGESALADTISRNSFGTSQFEVLFDSIDPSIKGTFNTQYRMHPAINDVIAQFYIKDGGLKCGLPLDESGHLMFSDPMSRYHGLNFPGLLSPEIHVVWINVNTPEIMEGTSRVNHGEISAIADFLQAFKQAKGYTEMNTWLSGQNAEEKEIGIISFYGKQLTYLEKMLAERHKELPVRLSTVDRFQGMERNVIIVSMVRSDRIASDKEQSPDYDLYGPLGYSPQQSLGFAESPNRLNVALSRARRLLVIVGNKDHFSKKETYRNVYMSIADSKRGKVLEYQELSNLINLNND
jgi:superfamily I DNA and/or RNA helicase